MNKYFNRELSWLEFNKRVLEIYDRKNLLLGEKMKFLSIFSENLDEFFMVRVGTLWDQSKYNEGEMDKTGLTPDEQLFKISKKTKDLIKSLYYRYDLFREEIKEIDISITEVKSLNKKEKNIAEEIFFNSIFPNLTLRVFKKEQEFPLIKNQTLNILLELSKGKESYLGNVQVPEKEDRLINIGSKNKRKFILLEDLIMSKIDFLFDSYELKDRIIYRVTRNADLDYSKEETEDLLEKIERSIKKRKWGQVVRLEYSEKNKNSTLLYFLNKKFNIGNRENYKIPGPIDISFLNFFLKKKWFQKYLFPDFNRKNIFEGYEGSIFRAIREKDYFCQFPYDDFSSILDFLKLAARDKKVIAIKQTLYRVSKNSPIIQALIEAANNGKNVTVVLEVKARFDEENNIAWAKRLEQAGVQVILSPLKIKTHTKLLLVIRKEKEGKDGLRKYAHLSTGNYNEKTATIYEDIGIFTQDDKIGEDIISIFNYLTSGKEIASTTRLIASPFGTRDFIYEMIDEEIKEAKSGRKALIKMKMNSLIDHGVIDKLYEASEAGVKIELIIRGICGLVPEENITVKSLVGRFLEHSRIYYFYAKGEEKTYISSMDMMERNLNRRVETLNPVLAADIKQKIKILLKNLMKDTENSYYLNKKGSYIKRSLKNKFDVHRYLIMENKDEE